MVMERDATPRIGILHDLWVRTVRDISRRASHSGGRYGGARREDDGASVGGGDIARGARGHWRTRGRSAEGDPLPKLAARSAEQRVTLCPIKLILSASRGVQRLVVWHPRPSDAAFSGLGDRGRPPSDRRLRSTAACMRSPAATREPPPSVAYNALDHGPIEADQLRSGAEDSGRLSIRVVEYQPRHPVP